MIEVLRKPFVPLLLAGALVALGGCSGDQSETATAPTYHSETAPAPNGNLGTRNCTVGPTAGNNAGCETLQDQSLAPRH